MLRISAVSQLLKGCMLFVWVVGEQGTELCRHFFFCVSSFISSFIRIIIGSRARASIGFLHVEDSRILQKKIMDSRTLFSLLIKNLTAIPSWDLAGSQAER